MNDKGTFRNENVLTAIMALLKELDESGLVLVKRDVETKLNDIYDRKR